MSQEGEEEVDRSDRVTQRFPTVMPRSAIIDPVTFTANRTGHVGGRTVTVFYQYGHGGGLTVGRLDSSRSRSISGPN